VSESEHALQRLSQLNSEDRVWIVQRLSASARSRLTADAEESNADAPAAGGSAKSSLSPQRDPQASSITESRSPEPSSPAEDLLGRLCAARPERVFAALRPEPGWLVSAVLRAHPWPWSKYVLQALPLSLKAEVSRLERLNAALSRPALEVLLKSLAERAGAPIRVPAAQSRFERVLSKLRRLRGR
jgi:hypothetical protein